MGRGHVRSLPTTPKAPTDRHLDPLATLAFLAGATTPRQTRHQRAGARTVALPTAPGWVATIQELSAGRLVLGVGVLDGCGVPRSASSVVARGAIADGALAFLDRFFANDVVVATGSRSYSVRGPSVRRSSSAAAATRSNRAIAHGGGWMPVGLPPIAPRAAGRDAARTKTAAAARAHAPWSP